MWQDISKSDLDIIGIDEVGRGAWAGPMIIGICKIPKSYLSELNSKYGNIIKDSKVLSSKKRQEIIKLLNETPIQISYNTSSAEKIDLNGVGNENRNIIYEALNKETNLNYIYCDYVQKLNTDLYKNITMLTKGETKSIAIAIASIYAKEYRDNIMKELHNSFPVYDWNSNVGYGTKKHEVAIKNHGICIYHRKSFLKRLTIK